MAAESVFDRLRPPPGGFTAEDLDRIPDLPPHTELIDGSLVFASPRTAFHMLALRVLDWHLAHQAPKDLFAVVREMSVIMGRCQRPEPDLVVMRAEAATDRDQTAYPVEAVVLAVEVVSPESELRDRKRKSMMYAEAGIQYFWRVEDVSGKTVVYAYELDPATGCYGPIGIFHDRVTLSVPFEIDIDLTEIDNEYKR